MRISFSGHRDKRTTEASLHLVRQAHPGAVWVHGGARKGFDVQVEKFARAHDIPTEVIRPDYAAHGKSAPLIRNTEIVRRGEVLYVCWDGRCAGGTWDAKRKADNAGKTVICLPVEDSE